MSTNIVIDKKALPLVEQREEEELQRIISTLLKRKDYVNTLYRAMFRKWNEVELCDIIIDNELYKNGEPEDYIGSGRIVGSSTRVYFKKSDIVKVLKYNPIQ